MKSLIAVIVVVWLLIGVVAAFQRDYFSGSKQKNCSTISNTAVTILAGPLNYAGANPQIRCKQLPQPSK